MSGLAFAHENEWSPLITMGISGLQVEHGALQGLGFGFSLFQSLVKGCHEFSRALVVDIPKTKNQRLRSGMQKTPSQTEEFVAGGNYIQAGRASAERDQLYRQPELVEVEQAQE